MLLKAVLNDGACIVGIALLMLAPATFTAVPQTKPILKSPSPLQEAL